MRLLSLFKNLASAPAPASTMTTAVGGSAAAAGNDTLATGQVKNSAVDHGPVTIDKGSAVFKAAATPSADGSASAAASTFYDVSGADFVISFTKNTALLGDGSVGAISSTRFIAIDIEGWSPPNGQVSLSFNLTRVLAGAGFTPKDNVATVTADANASGAHTYADTLTSSLAVTDQLSAVSAVAATGIA